MTARRVSVRLACAIVVCGLGLTACWSGDDDPGSDGSSSGSDRFAQAVFGTGEDAA